MPDVGGLVKNTDFNTKILDTSKKTSQVLIIINSQKKYLMQTKRKKLVDESDISNLVELSDLKTKLLTLTAKAELKADKII